MKRCEELLRGAIKTDTLDGLATALEDLNGSAVEVVLGRVVDWSERGLGALSVCRMNGIPKFRRELQRIVFPRELSH